MKRPSANGGKNFNLYNAKTAVSFFFGDHSNIIHGKKNRTAPNERERESGEKMT